MKPGDIVRHTGSRALHIGIVLEIRGGISGKRARVAWASGDTWRCFADVLEVIA